jgi:hypothetical protein
MISLLPQLYIAYNPTQTLTHSLTQHEHEYQKAAFVGLLLLSHNSYTINTIFNTVYALSLMEKSKGKLDYYMMLWDEDV